MRTSFLEWAARVAMLTLSGLVTLSIIGSIAAMSNDAGSGFPSRVERPPPAPATVRDEQRSESEAAQPSPERRATPPAVGAASEAAATVAATPPAEEDDGHWLEAIAYGLLALAGLAAIGCVLLWRLVVQARRAADALEASSLRPPPRP